MSFIEGSVTRECHQQLKVSITVPLQSPPKQHMLALCYIFGIGQCPLPLTTVCLGNIWTLILSFDLAIWTDWSPSTLGGRLKNSLCWTGHCLCAAHCSWRTQPSHRLWRERSAWSSAAASHKASHWHSERGWEPGWSRLLWQQGKPGSRKAL